MRVFFTLFVVGCFICSPVHAGGGLFRRNVSVQKQVIVQKNVVQPIRQQVVVQKVVQQQVYAQPVYQQQIVQRVYAQPVVQQQVVQRVYAQPVVQQVVTPCYGGAGTLQLNAGGCQALYSR